MNGITKELAAKAAEDTKFQSEIVRRGRPGISPGGTNKERNYGEIVMRAEKLCVRFCRIENTEYLPGIKYKVEFNQVDQHLRIYDVWGCKIVTPEFINANFI